MTELTTAPTPHDPADDVDDVLDEELEEEAAREAAQVEALIAELEDLPAHPSAAARVLWIADDPTSSATELAAAVSADPALTARAMKMANSAYYGLSGRVSSATFAVTVLGFSTVRSLAVATTARVMGEEASVPPRFWDHAAATACACALVSSRVKAPRPDAFSLGLLHDLGDALLHRADRDGWTAARQGVVVPDSLESVYAERRVLGLDHARAAARVLAAWRFPTEFAAAIEHHHDDPATALTPLHKALVAGHALAGLLGCADRLDLRRAIDAGRSGLAVAGIDDGLAEHLAVQVAREASEVAIALNSL
jgi:HD-like signal output (HDOD) protein